MNSFFKNSYKNEKQENRCHGNYNSKTFIAKLSLTLAGGTVKTKGRKTNRLRTFIIIC